MRPLNRKGEIAGSKAYTVRRRLHDQGGSLLITLPKIWTAAHGLKEGDEVLIQFDSFPGLLVLPVMKGQAKVPVEEKL